MVTWGAASSGGDSSAVRDQLKGVQRIQATERAFAAILEDGSVVTWGWCSVWQWQLGVQRIQATDRAFAAIPEDESVVTWGDAAYGSDSWVCSGFRPQKGPLLRFWKMNPLLPGVMQRMAVTVRCAADSGHRQGLCCDSGRWIRCYLGWCSLWQWQFGS